jgi:hypothetical protein
VRAHAAHRLRLADDPLAPDLIEALGLDQREGNVAVEQRVVGEVDALPPTFAEELTHHVAATREGIWSSRLFISCRGGHRRSFRGYSKRDPGLPLRGLKERASVFVVGIEPDASVRVRWAWQP